MIKIAAILLMTIDHIGLFLLPECLWLRMIGRLAMPLFAFSIARGWKFTRNRMKYLKNMLLFAAVSQIPCTFIALWLHIPMLNIGITWLLSLLSFLFADNISSSQTIKPWYIIGLIAVLIVAVIAPVDYGLCGVLYPLALYYAFESKHPTLYAMIGMCALYAVYMIEARLEMKWNPFVGVQMLSVAALPVMLLGSKIDSLDAMKRMPKRLFYWYYPLHLMVLLVLRLATSAE